MLYLIFNTTKITDIDTNQFKLLLSTLNINAALLTYELLDFAPHIMEVSFTQPLTTAINMTLNETDSSILLLTPTTNQNITGSDAIFTFLINDFK